MKEKIVTNNTINEKYYRYTHESGLGILLYPMEGFSSSYALFGTKYGSVDTTFKLTGDADFTTVPEGIAHFLEHKLFESEDGDAFSLFAKTGASANAFTSFEKTCYLFSTTDNFEQSLEALMSFVQAPYFTDQTVQKEQGIIGQEIEMYNDSPDWRVFFNLLTSMYEQNPVRIDIAGTKVSIAQIDADLLYRCYNVFYNLNNMVVAIAGNFDVERAKAIIEKSLKPQERIEIDRKVPDEKREVYKAESTQSLQVSMPLFNIGYKELPVSEENLLAHETKFSLIMSAIVGKGSELYKSMYDEGLINSTFGSEVFCGRGYFANLFAGESRNPRAVMERIDSEITRFKQTGIDKDTFERLKKSMYGATIADFNVVESVATDLVSSYFSGNDIFDALDVIASLTLEDINAVLKDSFKKECLAISIINPIEETA